MEILVIPAWLAIILTIYFFIGGCMLYGVIEDNGFPGTFEAIGIVLFGPLMFAVSEGGPWIF